MLWIMASWTLTGFVRPVDSGYNSRTREIDILADKELTGRPMAQNAHHQLPYHEPPSGDQSRSIRRRVVLVAPAGYLKTPAGAAVDSLAGRLIREGHLVDIHQLPALLPQSVVGGRFDRLPWMRPYRLVHLRPLYQAISRHEVVHLMALPPAALLEALLPALVISKFLGKQTLVSFSGGSMEDITGKFSRYILPALRLVSHVTVPTEWSARLLSRYNLSVSVVPNSPDSLHSVPRLIQDVQPRILSFLMAGPDSNITTILRSYLMAKQKYPRVELVLVGTSDRLKVAAPLAQRTSGITLINASQTDLIRDAWDQCDLYLNNSTDDDLPIPVLNAMSLGIPTISCDAGGMTAVIQNSVSGLIFPSNDPQALADRIIDLIEQQSLVTQLCRSGPSEALRYSWP